jgi:hypothetical protein
MKPHRSVRCGLLWGQPPGELSKLLRGCGGCLRDFEALYGLRCRIRMTHNLLLNYGLYKKMAIYRPHLATEQEMTAFHSDDYINFLKARCAQSQSGA